MSTNKAPVETVGVVVLGAKKVLLVRHSEKADHLTDVYGLPAGRIEEGESSRMAAARELHEETGLVTEAENLTEIRKQWNARIKRKGGTEVMHFTVFKCTSYSGALRRSREGTPEWVELGSLSGYELLPNVEEAIREAELL